MTCPNGDNERVKRRYFDYLREADGRSPKTIEIARLALVQFDRFTGCKDYRRFKVEDAKAFKRRLLEGDGKRRAELSSRSATHSKLTQVSKFFRWLAQQPGYKKAICFSEVAYFALSARDRKIAFHRAEKPSPTVEQLRKVIEHMPAGTDVQLRNRALIACVLLTGTRVSALITLKLKHVRADCLGIDQDAREVATKFGKSFPTFFFPVGDDILGIFLDYVDYLQKVLTFSGDDPLFPSTHQVVRSAHMFETDGLARRRWDTPDPVRTIFRRAFSAAGVPYHTPHTVRRTLACLGQQICRTPEEMKAWSQNLGHDEVMTTVMSYGAVSEVRQAELISAVGQSRVSSEQRLQALIREAVRSEVAATRTVKS